MTYQNSDIIERLKGLEDTVQNQNTDVAELKGIVSELKNIVQSLDKEVAIQVEKQSHLYFRIEQLQKEIELLEAKGVKTNDKQRALLENALMAFLGGLITYIFGLLGGK